ncbi:MAG: hypothetical protein ABIJ09_11080 [Pseudomonadota bacterium]
MAATALPGCSTPHADEERQRSPGAAPWWLWLLGLGLGAVHLLAHLGAQATEAPPALVYVGFVHMVPDHASYLGFADQARRTGDLALRDPFTTLPQHGRFVMAFFWLVGLLARLTAGDVLLAWYLLVPLCSLALVWVLWWLTGLLFQDPGWRRVAVLLCSLGGGLGWLGKLLSAGLASREVVAFEWNWSLFGAALVPTWTLAHALLAAAAGLVLQGWTTPDAGPSTRRALLRWLRIPVLLLCAFLVHPYTGLAGLAIVGTLALTGCLATNRQRSLLQQLEPLAAVLIAGGFIAVLGLWARGDDVYRATTGNLFTWTEHYSPVWYPLMYGVPLLLAVLGGHSALWDPTAWTLRGVLVWCLVAMALSNMWFLPGVKFQFLVFLPLGLLATQGLRVVVGRWPWLATGERRHVLALGLALGIAGGPLPDALRGIIPAPGMRIHVSQPQLDLLAALQQLPDGGVLAPPAAAILVPWKASKPVFDGHWFLSPHHERNLDDLRRFYQADTPVAWKVEFLARAHVRYLLEDPWSTGSIPSRIGPYAVREHFRNAFGRVLELVVDEGSHEGVQP